MKKMYFVVFAICMAFASTTASAQNFAIKSGDIAAFAQVTEMTVEVTWNQTTWDGMPEEEYVNKKADKRAEKDKDPVAFKEAWYGADRYAFETGMKETFASYLQKKTNVTIGREVAPYKIVVNVDRFDIGFNVAISSKPSKLDATIVLYDNTTGGELVKVTMDNLSAPCYYATIESKRWAGMVLARSFSKWLIKKKYIAKK